MRMMRRVAEQKRGILAFVVCKEGGLAGGDMVWREERRGHVKGAGSLVFLTAFAVTRPRAVEGMSACTAKPGSAEPGVCS